MILQVDEHGRKHQFIIQQTADSGELTTAQIHQILMSQPAFSQPPVTIQPQVHLDICSINVHHESKVKITANGYPEKSKENSNNNCHVLTTQC